MNVGFIGLGKLGMPCAEAMADAGHTVYGFDIAPRTSSKIKVMPTLESVVTPNWDNGYDVTTPEIIFIAVETPHDPEYGGQRPISHLERKDFKYSTVRLILVQLNQALQDHPEPPLVVLISTVLPGTTRSQFIDLCKNFPFVYNPYLIAMGSVAWDMVNPEMVIIGTEDGLYSTGASKLIQFYRTMMQNDPRYVVGTWDEAESIKIFYNTFISAKIGLVNMIQDVAEKNGNINVDVVTEALAASTFRITGPKYMKAGMGDAGPCHPRDNIALSYLAERLDLKYDLFSAIMGARETQARNIAERLVNIAKAHYLPIYIHGESYKPGVSFVDGSYSHLIEHYVKEMGLTVTYLDPLTQPSVPKNVKGVILMAHNAKITYDYTGIPQRNDQYAHFLSGSIVVDPWREYPETPGLLVIHYGNSRGRS